MTDDRRAGGMGVSGSAVGGGVWRPPPRALRLAERDVHVWRIDLDVPDVEVARLSDIALLPDERARVARFRRPMDGARFGVARARLRQVLARYADCAPRDIRFVVDDFGKPHLAADEARVGVADLTFNLSHASGLALVAVARGCRVGIDVETVRGHNDLAAIAARYYASGERAYLAGLSGDAWRDAFFALWTAKEAYTKAVGAGLSAGFTRFDVVVRADGGLALEGVNAGGVDGGWSLRRLAPGPGYFGALAVDVQDARVACWDWPDA